MTQGGNVTFSKIDGVPVFLAPAYFTAETGQGLLQQVHQLFKQGHTRFVLDFQECKVINSPGISSVMDLALKLLDDYRGKLAITNLDPVKVQVFTLVGVFPLVPLAPTVEEAIKVAKE